MTAETQQYLAQVSQIARQKWADMDKARSKKDKEAISKEWRKLPDSAQIVVETKFDEKGNAIKPDIFSSSGNKLLDQTAVDAVKAAAPYPAPPKKALNQQVKMIFVVRYNPMVPLK
jgi:TonB family protein